MMGPESGLTLTLWTLCITAVLTQASGNHGNHVVRQCEPITIRQCAGLGYNVTGMPNLVGHNNQQDAEMQLQTFTPLVQYGCSPHLRFFLCSVYVPMCTTKVVSPIGPCRPLCEAVRGHCRPVLEEFGFPWPAALDCHKFPEFNGVDRMCMPGPGRPQRPGDVTPRPRDVTARPGAHSPPRVSHGHCQHLPHPERFVYSNRTRACLPRCRADLLFPRTDKHFMSVWMAVWAGLCFVSSLFTVLTFLIDPARFRYPERPIILLSLAYVLCSIAYLVRLIAGRDAITCTWDRDSDTQVVVQDGLENTDCAIVFLFLFYFSSASALWWLVLTFVWFLAAGLKWGHEAIQRHSSGYHLLAWGLPAIKTILLLMLRRVDTDELTGLCHVTRRHPDTFTGFVVAPLAVYLLLGTSFLVAGFVAMVKIRRRVRRDGVRTDRLDVLMLRIGVYSVFYVVPAACVLGSLLYERSQWARWDSAHAQPNVKVFILKVFMSLIIGATSGVWVWSAKTVTSWRGCMARLCGCVTSQKVTRVQYRPCENPSAQRKDRETPHHPPSFGKLSAQHYIT